MFDGQRLQVNEWRAVGALSREVQRLFVCVPESGAQCARVLESHCAVARVGCIRRPEGPRNERSVLISPLIVLDHPLTFVRDWINRDYEYASIPADLVTHFKFFAPLLDGPPRCATTETACTNGQSH